MPVVDETRMVTVVGLVLCFLWASAASMLLGAWILVLGGSPHPGFMLALSSVPAFTGAAIIHVKRYVSQICTLLRLLAAQQGRDDSVPLRRVP